VQAALHQDFAHSGLNKLDGFVGRGIAVRRVDNFDPAQVQFVRACDRRNLCCWSDQDGDDKIGRSGFYCTTERSFVAGVNDERLCRLNALGSCDQTFVFGMRL
jgi:hypothetical protein